MTRIFTTLALFSWLFAAVAMLLGLTLDLHSKNPTPEARQWAVVHRLCGVGAAVAVVFTSSIVVTYFIGTSRWCKEVAATYSLDPRFVRESNRLKRRAFPWAMASMLTAVGIVALGGAADPASLRPGTENWVIPHLIGALLGMLFIAAAYLAEWRHIAAHHVIIDQVMAEVKRIRTERGLEV